MSWVTCVEPGWSVRFEHPATSPVSGAPVRVERSAPGAPFERYHVIGSDPEEIYFEVRRAPDRTTEQSHSEFRLVLSADPGTMDITDLAPRTIDGVVGAECEFTFRGGTRHVVYLEQKDALYRIIFRPASPTNWEILDTVQVYRRRP